MRPLRVVILHGPVNVQTEFIVGLELPGIYVVFFEPPEAGFHVAVLLGRAGMRRFLHSSDIWMVPLIPSRTTFSFSSGLYALFSPIYIAWNKVDHN